MVHVAGGVWEDGFYFDTHAHPVPPGVLELVAKCPAVPVMIERDADFDFDALARELAEIRALPRSATQPHVRSRVDLDDDPGELATAQADLATAQADLAAQLAGVAAEPTPLATRIGSEAIDRARTAARCAAAGSKRRVTSI